MCCTTRCELLQFHEEEAENLRLYRQLANDQRTRLAPSQELPFSPFPQPDCVECPHISTHCVPNDYYAAAELASAWHFRFDSFVVDHPKTVVLCLVLLVLLVFRIARRTLRNVGGCFTLNPKRYFEEMRCSDEMNIEKFWTNGDPTSSVAAGAHELRFLLSCLPSHLHASAIHWYNSIGLRYASLRTSRLGRRATSYFNYASLLLGGTRRRLGRRITSCFDFAFANDGDPTSSVAAGEGGGDGDPTSSVAAGEWGGEGGRLSNGKDPAWVPVVDCED